MDSYELIDIVRRRLKHWSNVANNKAISSLHSEDNPEASKEYAGSLDYYTGQANAYKKVIILLDKFKIYSKKPDSV